jgi:hypothetical protein
LKHHQPKQPASQHTTSHEQHTHTHLCRQEAHIQKVTRVRACHMAPLPGNHAKGCRAWQQQGPHPNPSQTRRPRGPQNHNGRQKTNTASPGWTNRTTASSLMPASAKSTHQASGCQTVIRCRYGSETPPGQGMCPPWPHALPSPCSRPAAGVHQPRSAPTATFAALAPFLLQEPTQTRPQPQKNDRSPAVTTSRSTERVCAYAHAHMQAAGGARVAAHT